MTDNSVEKNTEKKVYQQNIPKLRFKEFEGEWKLTQLKDLSKIQRGASPRPINDKKWYDNENRKVGWVRIGDVTNSSKYLTETEDYFSEEGIKKSRFLPKGSLIMSICATIGKPIVTDIDTCIHDGFVGFSNLKNVHKEFLYYYLNILEPKFMSLSQTGSQANLNSDLVRISKIGVPSLKEQEKIINFLSEVDTKIKLLNKKLDTQISFKKNLLQNIFAQKLRFDFNDEWKKVRLNDVLESSPSNLSLNDLEDNEGNYDLYGATGIVKAIDFYEKKVPYLAIVKDGAGVGKSFLCKPYTSIVGTMQYLTPKEEYDLEFSYYLLKTINFRKYIVGSTIPHIYFKDYSKEKIKVPSLKEQEKIGNLISNIDRKINLTKNHISQMEDFKNGLLQSLFI